MLRTEALDLHWHDAYYCNTCAFYTGQLEQHEGHIVIVLPRLVFIHQTEVQQVRIVLDGRLCTPEEYRKRAMH